ncbi:unnamed protein product [Sphagnum jensenii]|jgi:hypothetical protein|uniref:Uncharacterized protein n=1 Tax=Sphagnum jensenii TaxID=128206 RepID=A0ABP0WUT4_9BRYO
MGAPSHSGLAYYWTPEDYEEQRNLSAAQEKTSATKEEPMEQTFYKQGANIGGKDASSSSSSSSSASSSGATAAQNMAYPQLAGRGPTDPVMGFPVATAQPYAPLQAPPSAAPSAGYVLPPAGLAGSGLIVGSYQKRGRCAYCGRRRRHRKNCHYNYSNFNKNAVVVEGRQKVRPVATALAVAGEATKELVKLLAEACSNAFAKPRPQTTNYEPTTKGIHVD